MMNTLDDESYSIPSMQTTYFYTIHAFLILLFPSFAYLAIQFIKY